MSSADYKYYIIDRADDKSIDLILKLRDTLYIVQAKWCNMKNCTKNIKENDLKKTLQDFSLIKNGIIDIDLLHEHYSKMDESSAKIRFKKLLEELSNFPEYIKNSGRIKFLYITLRNNNEKTVNNINNFNKNDSLSEFNVIDINDLRNSYIDKHIKKIVIKNPFNDESPDRLAPTIKIERTLNNTNNYGDYIAIQKGRQIYESYLVLVKPKEIYKLFEIYGFNLFIKNIRNPLPESNINEDIVRTLVRNPGWFWYFNNGITAVTRGFGEFRENAADNIKVKGLDVINGAQTVYSIHKAYKSLKEYEQSDIDQNALITIRIIKSSEYDFNLNITKFTNSQNPLIMADFYANNDSLITLQEQSYDSHYNIWFARRRAEFRNIQFIEKNNISVINNSTFGKLYISYYLNNPIVAISNPNKIFTIEKDDGYFERIFENTTFEEIIFPYYISKIVSDTCDTEFRYQDDNIFIKDIEMITENNKIKKFPNHWLIPEKNENISIFALIFIAMFDIYYDEIIVEHYNKKEDELIVFIAEIYKKSGYKLFQQTIIYTAYKLIDFVDSWDELAKMLNEFELVKKMIKSDLDFAEIRKIHILN